MVGDNERVKGAEVNNQVDEQWVFQASMLLQVCDHLQTSKPLLQAAMPRPNVATICGAFCYKTWTEVAHIPYIQIFVSI